MVRRRRTAKSVVVGLASTLSVAACGSVLVGAQDLFSTFNAVNARSLPHEESAVNITAAAQGRIYEHEGYIYARINADFPAGTRVNFLQKQPHIRGQRGRVLQQTESKDVSEYLNGLVEASVAEKDKQLCNVAYLKTHKTGSTTLSTILYRYGVRHGRQVARYGKELLPIDEAFPKILETCGGRVDVMHLHIGNPFNLKCTWDEARDRYRTVMRDPDNINFITIVREPREHLLSYFYCCMSPGMGYKSFTEYLEELEKSGRKPLQLTNPLAGELGIKNAEDLDSFVKNAMPQMKLILLTNRFDEGLMVLRKLMGWHMMDMTYMTLRVTKIPTRRQLGSKFEARPHFDELPTEAQDRIDELTVLDKALYEACEKEFERIIAPQIEQVESDLVEFHELQQQVEKYLTENPVSTANKIYKFTDIFNTYPPANPF